MRPTNLLRPVTYSTDLFSFKNNTFVVEDSTLRAPWNGPSGRVYNDACDVGFTLVNQKTGGEIVMAQDGTDKDREGEVLGWRFTCVYPKKFKHLKALIIND
jgi:hypothetical protein